jgi:hypothetical protein
MHAIRALKSVVLKSEPEVAGNASRCDEGESQEEGEADAHGESVMHTGNMLIFDRGARSS